MYESDLLKKKRYSSPLTAGVHFGDDAEYAPTGECGEYCGEVGEYDACGLVGLWRQLV